MAIYDSNKLQEYYDSRNYAGAADYLRTVRAKDYDSQIKLNSLIHKLDVDAAKQKSLYSNLEDAEKEAYEFIQGIKGNGTIPRNRTININGIEQQQVNGYGTDYLNNIASLRANDGSNINRIGINIDSDEDLTRFTSILGINNINSNNLGIVHQALGDGKHRLIIDKNNNNLYKAVNASNKLTDKSILERLGNIGELAAAGTTIGTIAGSYIPLVGNVAGAVAGVTAGSLAGIAVEMQDYVANKYRNNIVAIDQNGKVYNKDDFNYDSLEKAVNKVNDAEDIFNKIQERREEEQTFTSRIEQTPFLGAGHAQAYKALQDQRIDMTTYDKIVKNWEDAYDRLIQASDFAQYNVYAWSADSGEGVDLKKVDNANIPDLQSEVLAAMHDNRLSYNLGMREGVIGTYLSITPKTDTKSGNWSTKKGEVRKTIFIPNLFVGDAEGAFEADTQTQAVREDADMKKYNYSQKLANGKFVGYEGGIPYIETIDSEGNKTKVNTSEEDVLRMLNESIDVQNSVSEVLARLESDGNVSYVGADGKSIKVSPEDMLYSYATSTVNEVYPTNKATHEERLRHQSEIYRLMLSLYNYYYNLQNN